VIGLGVFLYQRNQEAEVARQEAVAAAETLAQYQKELASLNEEFAKILRSPEVIELFTRAVPSFEVEPSTPEALGAFVKAQHEQMGAVIRRLGIKIE
jgi:tripartite-type tricarboxylate transporter receptor subunit TctC